MDNFSFSSIIFPLHAWHVWLPERKPVYHQLPSLSLLSSLPPRAVWAVQHLDGDYRDGERSRQLRVDGWTLQRWNDHDKHRNSSNNSSNNTFRDPIWKVFENGKVLVIKTGDVAMIYHDNMLVHSSQNGMIYHKTCSHKKSWTFLASRWTWCGLGDLLGCLLFVHGNDLPDESLLRSLRSQELRCQQFDRGFYLRSHAHEQLCWEPGDGWDDPKIRSGSDDECGPHPVSCEFFGLWIIPKCDGLVVLALHAGVRHCTHLHLHQYAAGAYIHRRGRVPSRGGAAGSLWQCGGDPWSIAGWNALPIWGLFFALHRQCWVAPALCWYIFALNMLQGNQEWQRGSWTLGCSWLGSRPHLWRSHCDHLLRCHGATAAAEWHLHLVFGGLGCFRAPAGRSFCENPGSHRSHLHRLLDVALSRAQHLCSYGGAQPVAVCQSQVADGRGPGDLWLWVIFHGQLGAAVPLGVPDSGWNCSHKNSIYCLCIYVNVYYIYVYVYIYIYICKCIYIYIYV